MQHYACHCATSAALRHYTARAARITRAPPHGFPVRQSRVYTRAAQHFGVLRRVLLLVVAGATILVIHGAMQYYAQCAYSTAAPCIVAHALPLARCFDALRRMCIAAALTSIAHAYAVL